ncbi:MAG: hypothetical protein JXB38_15435, partial [Anaerolineales bacterium]|nr:hypothetical protein [Anaerolineales bacterium]
MNEYIARAKEELLNSGKYKQLLERLEASTEKQRASHEFELLFAYTFDLDDLILKYEYNANPTNNKTVDFLYETSDKKSTLFELVSPQMSDELRTEVNKHFDANEGIELSSNHPN